MDFYILKTMCVIQTGKMQEIKYYAILMSVDEGEKTLIAMDRLYETIDVTWRTRIKNGSGFYVYKGVHKYTFYLVVYYADKETGLISDSAYVDEEFTIQLVG